jgi:NADH-quinone oxidoreductase subunit J
VNEVFYASSAIAIAATLMAVTRPNAVHALIYLIVSLLAVAVIFYVLGAQFVAALEVIIYAGAIMVLFLFAVMMLGLTPESIEQEGRWLLAPGAWIGPSLLAAILLGELIYVLTATDGQAAGVQVVDPRQFGMTLFGPYLLGVELASLLLLAGLVGAYHLGRRTPGEPGGRPGEEG